MNSSRFRLIPLRDKLCSVVIFIGKLRAFIGQITFEELSRLWVKQQGKAGKLTFVPQIVGSHWSRQTQVDVVAVNWEAKQILLGECKWGADSVGLAVVSDLIERKTLRLRKSLPNEGQGWSIHYALFSRAGVTEPALAELRAHGGISVNCLAAATGSHD